MNNNDFWKQYNILYEKNGKKEFIEYILLNKKFIISIINDFSDITLSRICQLFITYNYNYELKTFGLTLKKYFDNDKIMNIFNDLYDYTTNENIHIILNEILDYDNTNILLTKMNTIYIKNIDFEKKIISLENENFEINKKLNLLLYRIEFLEINKIK